MLITETGLQQVQEMILNLFFYPVMNIDLIFLFDFKQKFSNLANSQVL